MGRKDMELGKERENVWEGKIRMKSNRKKHRGKKKGVERKGREWEGAEERETRRESRK